MTQTQKKLKEFWEELLEETDNALRHGDHSSHSGSFDPHTGHCDPPYTGDGIGAKEDLKEWDEFMNDPLAMFDWDCTAEMPELAKLAFDKWVELQGCSVVYVTLHLMPRLRVFVVQAFARSFYEVATGKDFEVVSL